MEGGRTTNLILTSLLAAVLAGGIVAEVSASPGKIRPAVRIEDEGRVLVISFDYYKSAEAERPIVEGLIVVRIASEGGPIFINVSRGNCSVAVVEGARVRVRVTHSREREENIESMEVKIGFVTGLTGTEYWKWDEERRILSLAENVSVKMAGKFESSGTVASQTTPIGLSSVFLAMSYAGERLNESVGVCVLRKDAEETLRDALNLSAEVAVISGTIDAEREVRSGGVKKVTSDLPLCLGRAFLPGWSLEVPAPLSDCRSDVREIVLEMRDVVEGVEEDWRNLKEAEDRRLERWSEDAHDLEEIIADAISRFFDLGIMEYQEYRETRRVAENYTSITELKGSIGEIRRSLDEFKVELNLTGKREKAVKEHWKELGELIGELRRTRRSLPSIEEQYCSGPIEMAVLAALIAASVASLAFGGANEWTIGTALASAISGPVVALVAGSEIFKGVAGFGWAAGLALLVAAISWYKLRYVVVHRRLLAVALVACALSGAFLGHLIVRYGVHMALAL